MGMRWRQGGKREEEGDGGERGKMGGKKGLWDVRVIIWILTAATIPWDSDLLSTTAFCMSSSFWPSRDLVFTCIWRDHP